MIVLASFVLVLVPATSYAEDTDRNSLRLQEQQLKESIMSKWFVGIGVAGVIDIFCISGIRKNDPSDVMMWAMFGVVSTAAFVTTALKLPGEYVKLSKVRKKMKSFSLNPGMDGGVGLSFNFRF